MIKECKYITVSWEGDEPDLTGILNVIITGEDVEWRSVNRTSKPYEYRLGDGVTVFSDEPITSTQYGAMPRREGTGHSTSYLHKLEDEFLHVKRNLAKAKSIYEELQLEYHNLRAKIIIHLQELTNDDTPTGVG